MEHTTAYGGTSSATSSGVDRTNAYGGTSSATSSGVSHTNAYGDTTTATASGVTNCVAAFVSTQRTRTCRSFSRRIRSSDL